MSIIQGPTANPTTIELYGLIGEFRIANSPFRVKYFSTYANPKASGGHADLLDELLPMRDRLDATELKDLSSLLQRDLNDARVAQQLVPYLQGVRSKIGFFPAILAVLVPKDYLKDSSAYPAPQPVEDGTGWNFGSFWSVTQYSLGDGVVLPLGMLKIVRRNTEIVVLDGQHRATAFRFLSGSFQPKDSIYSTFYNGMSSDVDFKSDLPVTLIWFESDEKEVQPIRACTPLFLSVYDCYGGPR